MADKSAPAAPAFELVVIRPFADYQRGDHIKDAQAVADILAGECAGYVNKITPTAE
ncbi:hypothetical protein [Aquitalea aquatica]|uniref:Uncharacterized protein n=1 Tax=Aquitalea aquatica TaxID=3044273 RepID=A0A838Y905_9NEIS|nr:hypothetical protein [Aquitalea magnusonii]MBA4707515.1 hypothetical protein [Aquitalea magnusonii]